MKRLSYSVLLGLCLLGVGAKTKDQFRKAISVVPGM
jgi:hypothetical protein